VARALTIAAIFGSEPDSEKGAAGNSADIAFGAVAGSRGSVGRSRNSTLGTSYNTEWPHLGHRIQGRRPIEAINHSKMRR